MEYEYATTILYLNDTKLPVIKINPPDNSGWSLLSMTSSPNGSALFYTWAKRKSLTQFASSDSAFEQSLNIVQSLDQQEAMNKITNAVSQLEDFNYVARSNGEVAKISE